MATSHSTHSGRREVLLEAAQIQALRPVCAGAIARLQREVRGLDPHDAMYHGRLIEAIDVLEHALFNVLNTASAYTDCDLAADTIRVALGGS